MVKHGLTESQLEIAVVAFARAWVESFREAKAISWKGSKRILKTHEIATDALCNAVDALEQMLNG